MNQSGLNLPLISVIIAAKNAQATIEKCLDSVFNIDYPNYEVIVINDGSTDNTFKQLEKYSTRLTVLNNSTSLGPAKSRNDAAFKAKGEFLAFTDADCIVDRNWLKELVRGFTEADIVSVGGIQEMPGDETVFGRKVHAFMKKIYFISDYVRKAHAGIIRVAHNPSCNVMYRKEIFLQVGGFLEGFWPGEDVELDYRLSKQKYKLLFNPAAIVYHYRPDNFRKFSKMMYRYGWSSGFLVRRWGIFRKIYLVPIITFSLFVLLWINWKIGICAALSLIILAGLYFLMDLYAFTLAIAGSFFWHLGFIKGFLLR